MAARPRLSENDIACWVVKSQRHPSVIAPGWTPGSQQHLTRCLRRSYRVELMQPGQRCLLWLSGRDEPGVHAIGTLASAAQPMLDDARGTEAEIEVSLRLLTNPIHRSDLLAHPTLANAEVLRMPAGSNPSYLTPQQWSALRDLIAPEDLGAAGR